MNSVLISTDLFHKVLIDPLLTDERIDTLNIVSGYVSASMVGNHRNSLMNVPRPLSINLIYGMASTEGVPPDFHQALLSHREKKQYDYAGSFNCFYVNKAPCVHSKLYVWCHGNEPIYAFAGSANYSKTAFLSEESRKEILVSCPPEVALAYYNKLTPQTIAIEDADIAKDFSAKRKAKTVVIPPPGMSVISDTTSPYNGYLKLEVPLLTSDGTTGLGSHLNWGHRKDGTKRERNQAYIGLNRALQDCGFFPPRGECFVVYADDGEILECVRAQDCGKAIETTHSNSHLGAYFRKRLGLPSGALVELQHLLAYGRTSVTFYKDPTSEEYHLDFRPPIK